MKAFILLTSVVFFIVGCSSTRQIKDEYFGYSSFPEREKKEKVNNTKSLKNQNYPTITSSEPLAEYSRQEQDTKIVINNYYGPFHPHYYPYDPFDTDFWIFYSDPFYYPYRNFSIVYVPYHHKHFIYYPYPYDPCYWDHWMYHRGVVYVPTKSEPQRPRTVRDFGPSRSSNVNDRHSTPTRQSRSSSRDDEKSTSIPTINPNNKPSVNTTTNETIKVKTPKKYSEPNSKSSKEAPTSKTKNERSSTRPK